MHRPSPGACVVAWRPAHLGALTGHPMVPVLAVQIDTDGEGGGEDGGGSGAADVTLPASRPHEWLSLLLGAMTAVASGERAAVDPAKVKKALKLREKKKKKSAKEWAARGRASARAVAAKKVPSGKRVYDDD